MPTPFEIHRSPLSPAVALATGPQLTFIGRLISEHDWQSAAPAYVTRVATISATLYIAQRLADDPAANVPVVAADITDPTDLACTFHELMTASAGLAVSDGDAERMTRCRPLTKSGASALIDWLQAQPGNGKAPAADGHAGRRVGGDAVGADVVPAGRYAIDTADGATNALAFYRVDRPTEGRWAGYVFVKLITGGDEQRLGWTTSKTVLTKIAEAGAAEASMRYGHEIGNCGVCGRQLTNDESRAAGIGPVCRAKAGW